MIDLRLVYDQNRALVTSLHEAARATAAGSNELRETEVFIGELLTVAAGEHTPISSGILAVSHAVFQEGSETFVMIAPDSVNPYSDENPPEYGPKVHAMGGISRSGHRRDFYIVTVEEDGDDILEQGADHFFTTLEVLF